MNEMIALLQRVNYAAVTVDNREVARIESGLLAFIGVEKQDTDDNALALFDKIRKFRMFADQQGKLNLNIEQAKGQILIVPQFTLPAETQKGNRPSFDPVADPETASKLFQVIVQHFCQKTSLYVQTGIFKAEMKVLLENDGPLTFWLRK